MTESTSAFSTFFQTISLSQPVSSMTGVLMAGHAQTVHGSHLKVGSNQIERALEPIFVNTVFINHARLVEQKAAYHQADTFSIPALFKL